MVEAGAPYVQLNYSRHVEALNPGFEFGWDTHIYNFELLQDQLCPILDRAFSALLDDLRERLKRPVVLLYPGHVVDPYGLRFMGKCEPTHGYRAKIFKRSPT